jgi:gliding motility-associated-like protein
MSFHSLLGLSVVVSLLNLSSIVQAQPFLSRPTVNFVLYSPCANSITIFEDQSNVPEAQILERLWDLGDGSPIQKGNRVRHRYAQGGSYTVSLSLRLANQEILQSRKSIVIAEALLPPIPYSSTACFNEEIVLRAKLPDQSAAVIQWYQYQDAGNSFHQGEGLALPALKQSVRYYLESRNADGCRSERVEISVRVLPSPEAQIIVQPERLSLPVAEAVFAVAANVPIQSWDWDFGDQSGDQGPNPIHEYQEPGNYQVRVKLQDENGCNYQLSHVVGVAQNQELFIPSAFSPNGDGVNDWFRIGNNGLVQFQIEIVDNQGRKVFGSQNPDFKWDGKDLQGRSLPEGEYGLSARGRNAEGRAFVKNQTVILIR